MSKLVQVKQIETQSDHDLVLAIVKINGTVNTNSSVRTRDYRGFNCNDFLMELCGLLTFGSAAQQLLMSSAKLTGQPLGMVNL